MRKNEKCTIKGIIFTYFFFFFFSGRNYLFDQEIERVDWAEPEPEVDEETMKKVKVLFIRNLALQVTEENITSIFEEASGGPIDRVKKSKDYAFVHFRLEFQFFFFLREIVNFSIILSFLALENKLNLHMKIRKIVCIWAGTSSKSTGQNPSIVKYTETENS